MSIFDFVLRYAFSNVILIMHLIFKLYNNTSAYKKNLGVQFALLLTPFPLHSIIVTEYLITRLVLPKTRRGRPR